MKFVFFLEEGLSFQTNYLFKRWGEALSEQGNDVEMVIPYGASHIEFNQQKIKTTWPINGETVKIQGDIYFTACQDTFERCKDLQGYPFLVWNRYTFPLEPFEGRLILYAKRLMEYYSEKYSQKTYYIPPIIDDSILDIYSLEEKSAETRFVFWGDQGSGEDLRMSLQALNLLRGSLPRLKLYVIGTPLPEEPCFIEVEEVTNSEESFYWQKILASSKAILWSRRLDQHALNLEALEIMALSKPLICFACQGLDDYARPGENCLLLYPVKCAEQVAVEILRLCRQGQIYNNLVANARRMVKQLTASQAVLEIESLALKCMDLQAAEKKDQDWQEERESADLIIISFNSLKLLQDCLESIKEKTKYKYNVIIVDNASTDGSQEYLKGLSGITCILNKHNLGYAKACNQGILAGSGEYIVFLNCDILVTDNWLTDMIECASGDEKIAVVGPKLVNGENLIVGAGVTEFNDVCSPRGWLTPDGDDVFGETEEVINVSGACYLIKRKLLTVLGMFDEQYFFYFEETDYSLRAREKGYKVIYYPKVKVFHLHEKDLKQGERTSRNKYFAQSRNQFRSKWQDLLDGKAKRDLPQNIVALGLIPWDFRFQRPQQLLTRFAKKGYRIIYINPYCSQQGLAKITPNLYVYSPPGYGTAILNLYYKDNRQRMGQAIKMVLSELGMENNILWVDAPYWEPLLKHLEYSLLVYNCMDAYQEFLDLQSHYSLQNEEISLLKSSDLVLASAQKLYQEKKVFNESTYLIPNGADNEMFNLSREEKNYRPADLDGLDGPIILYYGAISHWFDVELVARLASNLKQGNLVLIGAVTVDITPLQGLSRIRLLGEKDYELLVDYLRVSHLCIIPFKKNHLTEATNPVKMYEYLSAGKPVVAVNLPELEEYGDVITLADGDDFIQEVLDFIEDYPDGISLQESKRLMERVKGDDWKYRVQTIEKLFYEVYGQEYPLELKEKDNSEEALEANLSSEEEFLPEKDQEDERADILPWPSFWERFYRWLRSIWKSPSND